MHIIFSQFNSPTFNLAAEEFLFSERHDDLLFLYVNEPSVIIGSNQAIKNEVDSKFCEENNIQVIRRMSGGGAVYHDFGNLNFCFIYNRKKTDSSLSADFLQPIVSVLADLDIRVEIGKRKDLWLEGNYKVSGTASHIGKTRELHHGTLLYDTNLEMLEKALNPKNKDYNVKATNSVRSKVNNIKICLKEQGQLTNTAEIFFRLIVSKLLSFYDLNTFTDLSENEMKHIQKIELNKYDLKEWNYKK